MPANRRVKGVRIAAIGTYLPETVVTNADLEERFDTSDEWIFKNIGIKERRWSGPDEWTSDLGASALVDACRRANISVHDLDLVICGTYTPDHPIPATAVAIMRKCGISGTPGFDVNSGGCPGGTFSLDVGAKFVASGLYNRVAVVLADVNTKMFDPEDRSVGVIFGDGAACYILTSLEDPDLGVQPAVLRSDPDEYFTAYASRESRTYPDGTDKTSAFGNSFAVMNGRGVRDFALTRLPEFCLEVLEKNSLTKDDIDLVIFHQANYRIIHLLMEALGLPAEKTFTNVDKYGNTSGAGVPIALGEAIDAGLVHPGSNVLLVSFGAGMSHAATIIKWPRDASVLGAAE